ELHQRHHQRQTGNPLKAPRRLTRATRRPHRAGRRLRQRPLHRVRDGVQALWLADDLAGAVVDLPALGAGPVEGAQVVAALGGTPGGPAGAWATRGPSASSQAGSATAPARTAAPSGPSWRPPVRVKARPCSTGSRRSSTNTASCGCSDRVLAGSVGGEAAWER